MDDNELKLVKKLIKKDDTAWYQFYENYYKLIFKAIQTTVIKKNIQCFKNEDAGDILQNILTYIISNNYKWLKKLTKQDSLKSCLYHLSIHRTLDYIKSSVYQKRYKTYSLNEKSSNNNTTPPISGNITTMKSGIKCTVEIFRSANFLVSPFLTNNGAILPFPKPHFLP